MPPKPWKTISSRLVYENPWTRLREDVAELPNGRTTIYGVVECGRCVGVLPFLDNEHVVMVRQYRYVFGENHRWEMPTGGVKPGESLAEAVRRELREEAGYTAARWERLGGDLAVSNSVTDERAELWLAQDLTPVPAAPEPTEDLTVRLVPLDEALALVDRGELTDVLTVVGLLTLDRRRRPARPDG